jgi:hypothetical protein
VSGPLGMVSELGSPAASVWLFAPCRSMIWGVLPSRVPRLLHCAETTEKVRRLGGLFPSGLIRSFFPANQWF